MYFVCFFCMGWVAVGAWTIYQLFKYEQDVKEKEERSKLPENRNDIIEMNKEENLSEKEKRYLKNNPDEYKIGEINGMIIYGYRKNYKK